MSGQQCPICLRHKHHEYLDKDKKTGKRFIIEACHNCGHCFEIQPWPIKKNNENKRSAEE